MSKLTLLHITDCHLSDSASVERLDIKMPAKGIRQPLRSANLSETLRSLKDSLIRDKIKLDAVVFSGDGTVKGDKKGQVDLRKILLTELYDVGITEENLVATPGNHDIVAGTDPDSQARYKLFKNAWLDKSPVVVPFLDGIHKLNTLCLSKHVLKDPGGAWAIFPINSANWSQINLSDKDNQNVALLRKHITSASDPKLAAALESLCRYDVARVSPNQLNALKKLVNDAGDVRLRIAVLHHHLLPVDGREEFKPFADITNLGHLRQVLRELGFRIVIHGHKHVTAAHYDYVHDDDTVDASAHRMLTISGGTFGPTGQHPDSPVRIIEIDGLPHAPTCTIKSVSSAHAGRDVSIGSSHLYRLWEDTPPAIGPLHVCGSSIDDVYDQAIQSVKSYPHRPIVCTVNFANKETTTFPHKYPYGTDTEEKRIWFEETVKWWQLPASRIEIRIPYIHGSRLQRYGGSFDQIQRVVDLIRDEGETSKAIALVVDPGRDFSPNTPFASFCFVQFCLRPGKILDCIGYYRAQEFHHWWPVNVAELRHLQLKVAEKAGVQPGMITTISPYPRLSDDIRQPTKVAVPLIDQWVDNHPGRIAQIALALTGDDIKVNSDGIAYWDRCLNDMLQATANYHADGVPVAIEGLKLLLDWLEAAKGPTRIIYLMKQLHIANLNHPKTLDHDSFNRWKDTAVPLLEELRDSLRSRCSEHKFASAKTEELSEE